MFPLAPLYEHRRVNPTACHPNARTIRRFILGKAERFIEPRRRRMALLGAFPEFAVIGA